MDVSGFVIGYVIRSHHVSVRWGCCLCDSFYWMLYVILWPRIKSSVYMFISPSLRDFIWTYVMLLANSMETETTLKINTLSDYGWLFFCFWLYQSVIIGRVNVLGVKPRNTLTKNMHHVTEVELVCWHKKMMFIFIFIVVLFLNLTICN